MKYLLLLLAVFSFVVSGCEKDQNRKLLGAYFKYTINGKQVEINDGSGLNNNIFECRVQGDTALFINVSKLYEAVGFVIKAPSIVDGTYILDDNNRAYYTNPKDSRRYYTTKQVKGAVTIRRNTFDAKTLMPTLEGEFYFTAADTARNKSIAITNGSFLMERK